MVTALGVPPDSSGVGLDPLTHRRIIASRWASPGVITGLQVRGHPSLPGKYVVWRGAAVVDGGADGATELYLDDTSTESTVAVGDSAYDRIDRVYLRVGTSAADNTVHVDVKAGNPAASPVAPSIPAGCLKLADMRLPAGATSMASAYRVGDIDYAIPYGAGLGSLGYVESRTTGGPDWSSTEQGQLSLTTRYVPTDRRVDVVWTYRASTSSGVGSFVANLYVDGQNVSDGRDECVVFEPWARQRLRWDGVTLSGQRTHTVKVTIKPATARPKWQWQGFRSLEVVDGSVTI